MLVNIVIPNRIGARGIWGHRGYLLLGEIGPDETWLQPYDGFATWIHSGFWGVEVWYVPEFDASVAIGVIRWGDFGEMLYRR